MKSAAEMIREDPALQKAAERQMDQFKYFAALCYAPVVAILAFFRSNGNEAPLFLTIVLSVLLCFLIVAGAIFFFAYVKQNQMYVHKLMGDQAIEMANEANPSAKQQVAENLVVARRMGHLANDIGFPLLTISYAGLAISALISIWV